jgi:hypothetical protein
MSGLDDAQQGGEYSVHQHVGTLGIHSIAVSDIPHPRFTCPESSTSAPCFDGSADHPDGQIARN